jgi:cytochrome c oxidase subunit 3
LSSDAHGHTVETHAGADHGHAETPGLRIQFDTEAQQREATTLGMWIFLITEVMFFGGMFAAYSVYRARWPEVFAVASSSMNVYYGAANTVVLLCSSLTMVLAVRASQLGKVKAIVMWIFFTLLFGLTFLGVKAFEWSEKFREHHIPGLPGFHLDKVADQGAAQIFFSLYFAMTGLHALHMIVGVGIMTWLAIEAWRGKYSAQYNTPVDISGLYWHFVDLVWIYLFPLLYLIDRHDQFK